LHHALASLDVEASLEDLRNADLVAEDYFTIVNGAIPVRDRPAADRERIRLEYMNIWLEAAGIPHDELLVRQARQSYLAEFETPAVADGPHGGYRLFPTLMTAPGTQMPSENAIIRTPIAIDRTLYSFDSPNAWT